MSHSSPFAALMIVVAALATNLQADWPTYQFDSARSGSTNASPPEHPELAWTYQTPHRPRSAWDEPALWDGWSKTHDLKNRQVFDKALHVAIAGEHVYFGSSVDDTVYCLHRDTGDVIWTFVTEGPVRLAPTVSGSRLYVGSDDGFVYCLDRRSGELHWKQSLAPTTRRISGNGRVISPWAIRTGVVVAGETIYCGAGVIPSDGVYVAALDAEDGDIRWRTEMKDLPAQGYMLASPTRLYVVTGRDTPIVLDASTGKRLYKVKGGTGGTYALLAGDTLLYGPSKTGNVNQVGQQDVLASFQGNHMIVAQPLSYLQSAKELSSLDRGRYVELYAERSATAKQKAKADEALKKAQEAKQPDKVEELKKTVDELALRLKTIGEQLKACLKWRTPCDCTDSLILAGGNLIAGGDGSVMGVDANTGQPQWRRAVRGRAYGLAVSHGKLWVSTDEGIIYCFASGEPRPEQELGAPSKMREARRSYAGPINSPAELPSEIHGPFAEFVGPGQVRVEWETSEPMTSTLRFGLDMASATTLSKDTRSTTHEFVINDVARELVYRFQVGGATEDGREIESEAYRFDSHLEYLPVKVLPHDSPYDANERADAMRQRALRMVEACGGTRGYALVLGATDGQLAYELARASDLRVVVMEKDLARVKAIRARLRPTGMYGSRISVHHHAGGPLRYGPFLANLIVSEKAPSRIDDLPSLDDITYCLRPAGGTLILSMPEGESSSSWREQSGLPWTAWDAEPGRDWIYHRGKLPGAGEWTHQYGQADNAACSQDDLLQGPLTALWWGRPGARPMPDRGSRNPPPVSANGRLYIQGNRTLFGLDAYNGTILWAKQIPTMRRANMPRDGSNMVANDTHVCLAMGDRCVAFDGQTGNRLQNFEVPEFSQQAERSYNWGFVSRQGTSLIGSAVRRGSQYLGDKGEWYQTFGDQDIAKVTSDSLFSVNAYSGETEWTQEDGAIINSTITIADGRIYYIASRSEAARTAASGRLTKELLSDQVLVALDGATGEVLWEKPFDFSKCRYVTYMTHGHETLLVTGTDEKSVFHTYAFDTTDGRELWQHSAADQKKHHTGQLAHPTIVGQKVYFNKHTYQLRTGEVLGLHKFNWHGCGIMSASNHSVFSRYEYHGMLDLKTNQRTEFLGVRSGCWLSLIPSGGLLLAPETSAGCSCGHSIQTSLAYVPKAIAVPSERTEP